MYGETVAPPHAEAHQQWTNRQSAAVLQRRADVLPGRVPLLETPFHRRPIAGTAVTNPFSPSSCLPARGSSASLSALRRPTSVAHRDGPRGVARPSNSVLESIHLHCHADSGRLARSVNYRRLGLDRATTVDAIRRDSAIRSREPTRASGRSFVSRRGWVTGRAGLKGKLMTSADRLATELHNTISKSWRSGRRPSRRQRNRIERLVTDMRGHAPIGPKPEEPMTPIRCDVGEVLIG